METKKLVIRKEEKLYWITVISITAAIVGGTITSHYGLNIVAGVVLGAVIGYFVGYKIPTE